MSNAGVIFSFDDYSETWIEHLSLLESLGIRATFFITGEFVRDRDKAKRRLRPLVEAGHSLGVHTFSHRRATEMWQTAGIAWLNSDVLQEARILADLSGQPTLCFAYPYGDHDDATDGVLTEHFRFVRTFGKTPRFATPSRLREGGVTHATSIDNVQNREIPWHERQLAQLNRESKVWVVASHHINETPWGITPARLSQFARCVHDLGIRVLTFEDFA